MNITNIILPLLAQFWYFIPVFILLSVFKSSWLKGVFGEFIVNLGAKLFLDKEKYHLIKNVTLPTDNGSTQIDHIIVSIYGVFVVETKNMKGWIFGSSNQRTWTQKIYRHTSKFQNPLHQNYKHVKTLMALLELNEEHLHSVIVFVGDCTFKTEMPSNITYGYGYIKHIKSYTQPVLTISQVWIILNKIKSGRLAPSYKTNRTHIKHVQKIVAKKQTRRECPQCGSQMVLREAKRGLNVGNKFWGCTNFPRCKSTINVV